MRKILRTIDSISDYTAGLGKWLCYALVLVIVFDVVMRYVFNAPTLWGYETAMMLGGSMYVLAWSYTHRHHRHVRVDIIYSHLSLRGKAIIDVIGTFFLFFPFMILLIRTSGNWAWRAWEIGERSGETYWYPPLAPFRTIVLIAFCLFTFQAVAHFIRDFYTMVKNKPL